jgi:hypothetical protein
LRQPSLSIKRRRTKYFHKASPRKIKFHQKQSMQRRVAAQVGQDIRARVSRHIMVLVAPWPLLSRM